MFYIIDYFLILLYLISKRENYSNALVSPIVTSAEIIDNRYYKMG